MQRGGSEMNEASSRWQQPRVWLAWAAVAAFAALVLWLGSGGFSSSRTTLWFKAIVRFFDPDVSGRELHRLHDFLRKTAHTVQYGILALLAFRATRMSLDTVMARIAAIAVLVAIAVASIDEVRQTFLPERTGSAFDVMLDGSGALAAVAIAVVWQRRRGARPAGEPPT